ncbi:hypothetical protein [Calothrix sp. NIES-2098]|uniref:hypothetical protein n=1 Tax=Calothrix sp. NIES-2098 TaxID=1954171 RepID=UPI0030DA7DFD
MRSPSKSYEASMNGFSHTHHCAKSDRFHKSLQTKRSHSSSPKQYTRSHYKIRDYTLQIKRSLCSSPNKFPPDRTLQIRQSLSQISTNKEIALFII